MLIDGSPSPGHLTYCTNIHAADAWPDVLAGLRRHLPGIKASVAPFGGDQFKNGSITQSERLAKYNRLLAIEAEHPLQLNPWPNE